mmetsp:Transcript_48711/g.54492  ORF Transcript_48711/g.54492 Transcript_48711/m.54492 type:complete len:756 (-) Transcript_48711:139-2406(-)
MIEEFLTMSTTAEQRKPLGIIPIVSAQAEANTNNANIEDSAELLAKATMLPIASAKAEANTNNPNIEDWAELLAKAELNNTVQVVQNVPTPPSTVDNLTTMVKQLNVADEYVDNDDFDEEGQGHNAHTQTVDWKKENKEMDKIFESQAAKQLKDLQPFVMPEGFQKQIKFFDHQKDGLRWLIKQETNAPLNPFVRERQIKDGRAFYDRLTRGRLTQAHAPVKGSILADDMGLGKTMQTLGLILSNLPKARSPICTLIVCPKTVISNWINQMEDFLTPGRLRVLIYNGTPKQRSKMIQQVIKNNTVDILLSTYETIAAEFEKDRTGLQSIHDCNVKFHRIVLDEAQQIRNPKSRSFRAIQAVSERSEFRLALSGTPFVNKPEDIHSLLAFIGLQPLSDFKTFKLFISEPIKDRKRAGLTRLRAALAYVALRRTKNIIPNLNMPEKTIQIRSIDFPEGEHKDIHDVLFLAAQAAFQASIDNNTKSADANVNQAMFSLLLRVRQSCDSGALVSSGHYQVAQEVMGSIKSSKEEHGNATVTAMDGNRMIEHLQNVAKSEKDERLRVHSHSPKVRELLSTIKTMGHDEKGVIFSQWTSFLDIIGNALDSGGHTYTRIDGSMGTEERTQALRDLNRKEVSGTRFILCSLKAAGVGINLTRANVCFMMDPWWNASTENQAIDRVHRMGQTRPVRVYRLVMKDTIEERLLNVQKAKSALGKGTMAKLTVAEEKLAKITSLKDLFQIKSRVNDLDDDFVKNDWY